MERPQMLDLFCGAGGCSVGYFRAGFDVLGVDSEPQPRYPFEFVKADAFEYLAENWERFDAVHASPPCQEYSSLRSIRRFRGNQNRRGLVGDTRDALASAGRPWVIENVPGAPLSNAVVLCGSMFGLGCYCDGQWHQLRRHRLFEFSFPVTHSLRCLHVGRPVGVYGNGGAHRRVKDRPGINGFTGNASQRRSAMGIDWMGRYSLSQAIPPAYTEWVGRQILSALRAERHHQRGGIS